MRFFEEQRKAKQATFWLVLYFLIFVILISSLLALGTVIALGYFDLNPIANSEESLIDAVISSKPFRIVFLLNTFLIVLVSFIRTFQLSSGDVVATMLGGSLISSHTTDPNEKRLMNIVEEMSLASGVTMPMVYVLKNQLSVNAFAAGWDPQRAVVGVTQGSLDVLDRDELQGVVAHEFSHILNGDMALNMKLAGVISGLVFLSEIGEKILRFSDTGSHRRSSKKGNGNQIFLVALVLFIIGGLGVIGARFIQAAVSRQREFLADASAAQFTRNPTGLAKALAKIFHGVGSKVNSEYTHEMSHLFFANASKLNFFATHPSLEERIAKLDRNLNLVEYGKEMKVTNQQILRSYTNSKVEPLPKSEAPKTFTPEVILGLIGQPTFLNVEVSNANLEKIPEPVLAAARDQEKSLTVLLSLVLMNQSQSVQTRILETMKSESPEDIQLISSVRSAVGDSLALSFVLLQISLASLRSFDAQRKAKLTDSLQNIFAMDGFVSFSEVLLGTYVTKTLENSSKRNPHGNMKLQEATQEIDQLIFWLLSDGYNWARIPVEQQVVVKNTYLKTVSTYQIAATPVDKIPLVSYQAALQTIEKLQRLDLRSKSKVIEILWKTLQADQGLMNFKTAEDVRLLCSLIGAPVPPFMQYAS